MVGDNHSGSGLVLYFYVIGKVVIAKPEIRMYYVVLGMVNQQRYTFSFRWLRKGQKITMNISKAEMSILRLFYG